MSAWWIVPPLAGLVAAIALLAALVEADAAAGDLRRSLRRLAEVRAALAGLTREVAALRAR